MPEGVICSSVGLSCSRAAFIVNFLSFPEVLVEVRRESVEARGDLS